jgi:hypothetical protein
VDALSDAGRLELDPLESPFLRRVLGVLGRDWLLVLFVSFFVASALIGARLWFTSDSWYSVLYGREIVEHGFPRHDTLTVMGHGRPWVDQQWLGHVTLYGLFALGGAKLASLVSALVFSAAFVGTLVLARRRGASSGAVVLFGLLGWPYASTWPQAEVFSRLFFLGLLVLVAREARAPSWRVWLALPLLVVWANVHGAVLLGAALVALLGATGIVRGRAVRARDLALLVLPWPCVLATPYGLSVLGYYRSTITNPSFHRYVGPWTPAVPFSLEGAAFFALVLLTVVLVVRNPRRLQRFEIAVLCVTGLAAAEAVRSIPWFVAACLLFVAPLAPEKTRSARPPRLAVGAALLAAVLVLAALADAALRPRSAYTRAYPPAAASFVARYVRAHPATRVFASDPLGDWLAYAEPPLWGRIAFDARWEQLSRRQIEDVDFFQHRIGRYWKAPARSYALLVLPRHIYPWLARPFLTDPRYRPVYRDGETLVFERRRRRSSREPVISASRRLP